MINEKAVSKSQQRLFGQAYAVKQWRVSNGKHGKNPNDLDPKYKKEILELANNMSIAKLKEFANTKHKELTEDVKESSIKPIKTIYAKLNAEAEYDSSREKERRPGNLCDYREFIKKNINKKNGKKQTK